MRPSFDDRPEKEVEMGIRRFLRASVYGCYDFDGENLPIQEQYAKNLCMKLRHTDKVESLLLEVKWETQTADNKLKCWNIAKKLYNWWEIEVSIDDLKIIKDRAWISLSTAIYWTVIDLLEW